jgi:hypothetical protein
MAVTGAASSAVGAGLTEAGWEGGGLINNAAKGAVVGTVASTAVNAAKGNTITGEGLLANAAAGFGTGLLVGGVQDLLDADPNSTTGQVIGGVTQAAAGPVIRDTVNDVVGNQTGTTPAGTTPAGNTSADDDKTALGAFTRRTATVTPSNDWYSAKLNDYLKEIRRT